jgi:hypothetical protein
MARFTEVIFPIKKLVPLTAELAERVRDSRYERRLSSENEAIRRLIEMGLNAGKENPK